MNLRIGVGYQDEITRRVATVTAFVTVGSSHARYPSGNLTQSVWMGHAATIALSKAKSL